MDIVISQKIRHASKTESRIAYESPRATDWLNEAAMRLIANKFKLLFNHSIIAKSFSLPSGEMTINQAFCDMLGYSLAEHQDRNWQGIIYPDNLEFSQSINNSHTCVAKCTTDMAHARIPVFG